MEGKKEGKGMKEGKINRRGEISTILNFSEKKIYISPPPICTVPFLGGKLFWKIYTPEQGWGAGAGWSRVFLAPRCRSS